MTSNLVQEGLNSLVVVLLAGGDAVASDGCDELGLLVQQGAQRGLPLCSLQRGIDFFHLLTTPFWGRTSFWMISLLSGWNSLQTDGTNH